MLTDKCKQHFKDLLKSRYDIDCYRIVQAQDNAYKYFYFNFLCVCEDKKFEMLLTVSRSMRYPTVLKTHAVFEDIQKDIESDEFIDDYDFTLHIDTKNTDVIRILSNRMHNNLILDAVADVNTQFSLGMDSKYYLLYTKIIPLVGVLRQEKGWFNIKTVSEDPYFVGNLCSSFITNKRTTPTTSVVFHLFIYGDKFDYRNYKQHEKDVFNFKNDSDNFTTIFKTISSSAVDQFKKEAFQEIFFKYSDEFDFIIEDMTYEELAELDIADFVKYIEVQKMANI